MNTASRKLGELLVDRRLISKDVLERLLVEEAQTSVPLARTLVDGGHVQESDLLRAIADRINMEFLELDDTLFDPEAVRRIGADDARALSAVPIRTDVAPVTAPPPAPRSVSALESAAAVEPWPCCQDPSVLHWRVETLTFVMTALVSVVSAVNAV